MQRLRNKLKSRTGESIGESLAALLIASVALVMLAGMLTTTFRLTANSKNIVGDYYADNRILAVQTEADGSAGTVYLRVTEDTPGLSDEIEYPVLFFDNKNSKTPLYAYHSTEN